ncbi:MAG: hypothetical protein ABEN55_11260 [Bradymonadaceae bacterium]
MEYHNYTINNSTHRITIYGVLKCEKEEGEMCKECAKRYMSVPAEQALKGNPHFRETGKVKKLTRLPEAMDGPRKIGDDRDRYSAEGEVPDGAIPSE